MMDTTVVRDTIVVRDTAYLKTAMNPIQGYWAGTYKVAGNTVDSFWYSIDILTNGTMITTAIGPTNNSTSTAGPWQLNGTNFTGTLTYLSNGGPLLVQAVAATYDSVNGILSGTVNVTQGSGNNETFLLFRVD